MKRGKVSPAVLLVIVAVLAVAVILYLRFAPCCPGSGSTVEPPAPGVAPAAPAVSSPAPANVPTVSTAAVATAQAVTIEQREDELEGQMSEAYRKLGELRRAAQETPEARELNAAVEADRKALDELAVSDPAIRALTARRRALLDEMISLQARQTELARRARADATNLTLKAEGQAAIAKIHETSAELGTVTRKLEAAKQTFIGQNIQAAEIAARLAGNQGKARALATSNPEIAAVQEQIQRLAAESRQLGLRHRQLKAATPSMERANPEAQSAGQP